MIIHTMPQRSDEWYSVRCGKFTASDFDDLMPGKNKPIDYFTDTQMRIIYRVAAERITGAPIDGGYISKAMQWGIDTEAEARAAFEMETGKAVDEVGFCEMNEWVGCSPDGLIGEHSGLELKCPNSDTHLRYLDQGFGRDYYYQVQGSMWITGRGWYLASYDPRFRDNQLYITEVQPCEESMVLLHDRLDCAILKAKEIIRRHHE